MNEEHSYYGSYMSPRSLPAADQGERQGARPPGAGDGAWVMGEGKACLRR